MLDRVAFEGNKRSRTPTSPPVDRIQGARQPAARHGAGRRQPHHRGLPACRPRRRQRQAGDHRPRQRPRRSRLRPSPRARRRRSSKINFIGNTAFGKRQLAAVIKTSANNMLSFLTGGDVYDPDRVDADRELMRDYYRSKGYADVNVPSANAEYDPAHQGIHADLHDRRGAALSFRRYRVDLPCRWRRSGKTSPPAAGAIGRAVRRREARQEQRQALAAELAKLGYPFAQGAAPHVRDAAGRASTSPLRSSRASAPMSSASTSTATPARATT